MMVTIFTPGNTACKRAAGMSRRIYLPVKVIFVMKRVSGRPAIIRFSAMERAECDVRQLVTLVSFVTLEAFVILATELASIVHA